MKKLFSRTLTALALILSLSSWAQGTPGQKVILSFHTNIYDNVGENNAFHFELGATENIYVDVDCGYGLTEMEVGVASMSDGSIKGSVFSGTVSAAGNVVVYGDPTKIDYVMLEGLYMSTVDLSNLTNVEILNVCYNELESLDLSHMHKLMALYADANPCNKKAMVIGKDKPDLAILSLAMIDNLDPSFSPSDYPALQSLVAYSTPTLVNGDTSKCPKLKQFSVDSSNISSVDFSKNPELLIINLSETRVSEVDLSPCYNLREFYCQHVLDDAGQYKFKTIDVSKNPNLQRLFVAGNLLTSIDVSNNDVLTDLSVANNYLTSIDVSNLTRLYNLNVSKNLMWYSKLPLPANYLEYIYNPRPIQLERSYKVGTTLDFSDKVLREKTVTTAELFTVKRSEPGTLIPVDKSAYTYADGKVTLNEALTDSVTIVFSNSLFNEYDIETTKFMVKSAENYGQPSSAVQLRFSSTESNLSFGVGMAGATKENPVAFYVDFGNGERREFKATSSQIPAQPNVTGTRAGTITIYVPEGEDLTAVSVNGQRLMNVDFSKAPSLQYLSLSGCQLASIVLSWNNMLRDLDLSNNKLSTLSLRGINDHFPKNLLENLNLSHNQIKTIDADAPSAWRTADFSYNNLSELPFSKFFNLTDLNISNNAFTTVSLVDSDNLVKFNVSGNLLTELYVPDFIPLESLDLSGNNFTFENLPAPDVVKTYVYAPQKPVVLPAEAPVVSLKSYAAAANGTPTVFNWYFEQNNQPVPADKIKQTDAAFTFPDITIGKVYCTMTNAAFPEFKGDNILTTTAVQPAEFPSHIWGTFKPLQTGTGEISMTARTKGSTVYIDWDGNGSLVPYTLETTVLHFPANVTAGCPVTCYSLNEDEDLFGVSIAAGNLESADFSPLKQISYFSIYGSKIGAENLKLPESPALKELNLSNAALTDVKPIIEKYPQLSMFVVSENQLGKADVSSLKNLETCVLSYCELEEVTFDNPKLWNLHLPFNNLKNIDLSKLPRLDQAFLSGNQLETIDLSAAPTLRVIYIDDNRFNFQTLPKDLGYAIYNYANQAKFDVTPVDGVVDLSSQLTVDGIESTYTWYSGTPIIDFEGNVSGTKLDESLFTVEKGVTTFNENVYGAVCIIDNAAFPQLHLMTDVLDIIFNSVADVAADTESANAWVNGNCISVRAPQNVAVTVTDLSGRTIGTATGSHDFGPLNTGIYVVNAGADTFKLLVK